MARTVTPDLKKTVAFLYGESEEAHKDPMVPIGTAFFVGAPAIGQGGDFVYLVTAKHVVQGLPVTFARLNSRSYDAKNNVAGVRYFHIESNRWFFHDDPAVDIAVLPWAPPFEEVDYRKIGPHQFASRALLQRELVAEGDEVFFAGLLTQHTGNQRNYPVIRHGRIALLTDELIPTDTGRARLYLAECQAFPGNSGSPFFIRLTERREPETITLGRDEVRLMGVLKGYFPQPQQVLVREAGYRLEVHENVGIAAVVPVDSLIEVLLSGALVERRLRLIAGGN